MNSLPERIAFASYRNITVGTARKFAAKGISAADFFKLPARTLAAICCVREEFFNDSRRQAALEAARVEATFVEENGVKVHFFDSPDFPVKLAECDDAPAMLYSFGKLEPQRRHTVAIVGTRHCTPYGANVCSRLVEDLAANVDDLEIISGLAYGVDIAAHRAALAAGVPTGAVLAHGLNTIYPADHRDDARRIIREGGFILTEYSSAAPVHKGNFLARNRIVAGLADVTIVVESDIRGGAMTTARIAAAYNREVMAVPGRITDMYSRGCNHLLARREASPVRDAADIIELMGWKAREKEGEQKTLPLLSDEQQDIADFLLQHPDAGVNDMCAHLGIPYPQLSSLLFQMELENIVAALPGGRYALLMQ